MAKRQQLPTRPDVISIDDRAAIERCRYLVHEHAAKTWKLLFPPKLDPFERYFESTPQTTRITESLSASLQVELRDYCCALFDCEASIYKRVAKDEATLRLWLEVIATCVEHEELLESQSRFEGLHCSVAERQAVVTDGLKKRIEHHIEQKKAELVEISNAPRREEASPEPVRNRSGTGLEEYAAQTVSSQQPQVKAKSISDRLDEAVVLEDINHDEQARRIGIGRTTYYEVKNGRGGIKSRAKIENYLRRVLSVG